MLRFPDVSATHLCFIYANDIWLCPRTGGTATPLASPPGAESLPKFSPDGKTLAFVGNYDGNRDIYTVPVSGGIPKRITHHPAAENICDWTPDGRILFTSNGLSAMPRYSRMFSVSAEGGLPVPLPMPYSGFGSMNEDGRIAFTLWSTDNRTWKRYRGGMATDVWTLNPKTGESRQITDWEGTDTIPMWHGKTVYYLSDNGAEHRLNIWSYDTVARRKEQVTSFKDNDVKWPSIGPGPDRKGEIVFQLGSELRLLNLADRKSSPIKVEIPGARQTIRPRSVDVSRSISSFSLSPAGKRLALEARGDIYSAPAKEGVVRALTRSSDVAERDPAWSPDGKWIAYFSDESGEYELWLRPSGAVDSAGKADQDDTKASKEKRGGKDSETEDEAPVSKDDKSDNSKESAKIASALFNAAPPRKLTDLGPGFRFMREWSPDSKHITFTDQAGRLFLCTIDSGAVKQIDTDPLSNGPNVSWSSDSGWLAYSRSDDDNTQTCIWLHNVKSGENTRVTSPMFSASQPTFDREGKYLFFSSARDISNPAYSDIDTTFIYRSSEVLLVVPLRHDIPSPFAPKSDEEGIKPDKPDGKDEKKKSDDKQDDAEKKKAETEKSGTPDGPKSGKGKEVRIDLDGFERRAVKLPVPSGNFGAMAVTHDGKLLYVRRLPRGGNEGDEKVSIRIFDLKADEKEEKTVVEAGNFSMSADGRKIAVRRAPGSGQGGGQIQVLSAEAGGGKPTTVPTSGMTAMVDPRAEWRQIFTDAWRLNRDYFYEPTMHGVDWPAMRSHYGAMLDDCATREDVNFVIAEMISELNVGHAYITNPGDIEQGANTSVGLLGCEFALENGAYRITKIYEGGPWDSDARGPLLQPGVGVREGDYLLAVNGLMVDASKDPWAAFIGLAGKPTTITFSESPTIDEKARDVLITPTASETDARYRAWIEKNRKYVQDKSGGRIAYLHVPDTGVNGQNNLYRQFFGQRHLPAMLIDERWNGGGQIPTRFIELLNRPVTNYWAKRDGKDWTWPPDAHHGPKAMMINGLSGSGGDAFPAYFRRAGLGKLIGRRTWGGLVGISGNPQFVDGGSISVPTFGYYKTDGTWGIEGHGVDPDIDVVDDPGKMLDGQDPQLDAAIAQLLKELNEKPYVAPKRPQSPNRKGMGIPDRDR